MFLSKPMLGTQIDRSDSLNDGLVLDLLMNEGHGNIVNDLSGGGNHGTLHGFAFPPTRTSGWNPGMDGVALTFDGIDDYIDCGNNPSLNPAVAIAIDTLIKTPNTATNKAIVVSSISGGIEFRVNSDQKLEFLKRGVASLGTSSISILDNEWTRSTMDYDYITGDYNFYINGTKRGSGTNLQTFEFDGIYIGGVEYLNGSIARARILPRAMSAFEIMRTQINPYGVYQQ